VEAKIITLAAQPSLLQQLANSKKKVEDLTALSLFGVEPKSWQIPQT
jgi:hypothetical protein